ncbi:hypothetical protein FOL47_003051 [Perkinsus chesapeaki]|uniref:Uncharacterized protein n=1 Tax=Perkinsus chesapeaki TaxID=330153 RepID=A0A7J6MA73_PERCH|nr:hypothetical protein FOL47_003051 [Perkinsus chesapeaki]
MVREEGLPFVTWYGVWYFTGLGLSYIAVSWRPEIYNEVVTVMKLTGIDRFIDLDHLDPEIGKWTVILAMNNILEIPRVPFVLASHSWWKRAILARALRV